MGFTYLFGNMFGWHLSAGLVIWRSIEYLLPVLIAAPCMGMRSASGESILPSRYALARQPGPPYPPRPQRYRAPAGASPYKPQRGKGKKRDKRNKG